MALDQLLAQIAGGDTVRQLSRQLGADEGATGKAVSAALPMLLGAMGKNAQNSGGASALLGALDRDHDGSILDDIGGFLGQGQSSAGEGILGHVLGGRRQDAERGLGQVSGLSGSQVSSLLAMLAPLVMGALGRQRRSQGVEAGGLADLLRGEANTMGQRAPSGSMGMLGKLLDADGDGSVLDDVAKMGGGLLGGLLKNRR